jgi:hypothetical protein
MILRFEIHKKEAILFVLRPSANKVMPLHFPENLCRNPIGNMILRQIDMTLSLVVVLLQ